MSVHEINFHLLSEAATSEFAASLAGVIQTGDLVFLSGDMGAGKTALARALIQSLNHSNLTVASPTFTLVYPYDDGRVPVLHADLYRLVQPEEVEELGLVEALSDYAVLIEWAENGYGYLPDPDIHIRIKLDPNSETARFIQLSWSDTCAARLQPLAADYLAKAERQQTSLNFIAVAGWADATFTHIAGDASSRSFSRLGKANGDRAILMDWPAGPDGPPIYDGKPYSAKVHLAEAAPDFCAMVEWLHNAGFSAPDIYASALDDGLILLEDLGNDSLDRLAKDPKVGAHSLASMYLEAVELLTQLHECPVAPHLLAQHKTYDGEVLATEASLFLDWYVPAENIPLDAEARQSFIGLWHELAAQHLNLDQVTVLRDFHSPNILWLPKRQCAARIGLIDVQDAVAGSPAYDLVSLLQDARIDVDVATQSHWLNHYCQRRFGVDRRKQDQFLTEYAILGVQRNLKIAGIFHRLAVRDGKPQYRVHLPRIEAYLAQGLRHPALAPLVQWFQTHNMNLDWLQNVAPRHSISTASQDEL
jgi:tRNA threonylcarbamoyl adenosine modification protein YjeE